MASDVEILKRAYEHENDSRDRRPPDVRNWESYAVGASKTDVSRLMESELITISFRTHGLTKYKLTPKGRDIVWATVMERQFTRIPASSVMDAMSLIVGFEDVKEAIAYAIEARRKTNIILSGPPACAKSLMLEGVRSSVPDAFMVFGSRTSPSGLSDALFEHQPSILLLDEVDKIHSDALSVLLGLMESGEILETKSRKTRGIRLDTMVIAAGNWMEKMPQEFMSRFSLHVHFPEYTREEFINVCRGFLLRSESCPEDVANTIGRLVYDYGLGDVRKARGVWQLMKEPTIEEVHRIIQLMERYKPKDETTKRKKTSSKTPRLL